MPFQPWTSESKTKGKKITVRDVLFADDAALLAHSAPDLKSHLNQFSSAFSDFSPTISLQNTKVLSQGTGTSKMLKTLYTVTLVLRQTHQWTLRLIVALVTSDIFARLSGRVWDNPKLTIRTK